MKETIVNIHKNKSLFFEKINKIDKTLPNSSRKQKRKIKSTKLEITKEKLQLTPQKYQRL